MKITPLTAAATLAVALLLTGCTPSSSTIETDEARPTSTASSTVSAPLSSDPLTDFGALAIRSCEKAMDVGVVDSFTDGGKVVMIPKDEAIDGYSAAYFTPTAGGEYGLVYETDAIMACGAAMPFMMAEDAETDWTEESLGVRVTQVADSTWQTETAFGEETYTVEYTAADGLLRGSRFTIEGVEYSSTTVYGDVSAADRDIIRRALVAASTDQ